MSAVPRLHLVGPLGITRPVDYLGIATRAAAGGCDAIHLRVREMAGGDLLRLARSLQRELDAHPDVMLIINDRVDVALLCNADGVQLGERSFDVDDARRLTGDRLLIGRSIHNVDGARRAAEVGADYLLAGHIYDTPSKEGQPGRGLEWLAEVAGAVEIPVIAIGGITIDRLPDVLAAGAHGVALGRELLESADPYATSQRLRQTIEREVRP